MDAVTPFLRDAAVLLPWLSLIGCVRRVPWAVWLVAGGALVIVCGCGGVLTWGGIAVGAVGTCAALLARELGVPPRVLGPAAAILAGAVIAWNGVRFHETRYLPWITRVRTVQERYPPVPRSAVLPSPGSAINQAEPHRGSFAWRQEETFPRPDITAGWWHDDPPREAVLANLHDLHNRMELRFTGELGFGIVRMRDWRFDPAAHIADDAVVAQFPQPGESRLGWDGGLDEAVDEDAAAALAEYHTARGVDFANAPGFGVLARGDGSAGDAALPEDADPADVPFLIGFRPHASRTEAGDGPLMPAWRLHRVELIGLILHDEPVGYASESLPRMGETATHAVRPLTEFEAAALPKLAAGAWVHAAADRYRLRALGALPAAKACAECHGVPVGTLLGALSYDFLRERE